MVVGLIAAGALYGLMAGLGPGLPAFALGMILALAAQVIGDTAAEAGTRATLVHAVLVAASMQAAYGVGLLWRRARRERSRPLAVVAQDARPRQGETA